MTAKAATGAAASEAGGAADTTPKPDAATGAAAAGKTSSDGAAPDGQPKADEAKTGDEQKETQSGKTDDSKKAGGDEVKDQKKAPATYELTVPDDAKRFVTDADLERFQEIAKANDWTQEEAAAALTEEVTNAQERQTAGRGRRGRTWVSEPGNLYASLLLTAPASPEHWPQLSLVAALATAVRNTAPA